MTQNERISQLEKEVRRLKNLEKLVIELVEERELNKLDKPFYTVQEVAKLLKKTPQAIYAMIEREELETSKLGRTLILGKCLREKIGLN